MLAYALPRGAGINIPPNVTVARDLRSAPGDDPTSTPGAYLARQVTILELSLVGFRIERRRIIDGRTYPIAELLFSWQSAQGRIRQWLFFLFLPDNSVASLTATAAEEVFADYEPAFTAALHSLRFDVNRFPPANPHS